MFCRFHLQADFYDDCCTNVRCQKGPDMIRNPEYFIAIVESGSLTKAAKKLYLSQPYLSQYLKQLEQSLGVELFDHSVSPLTPTYAGQLFYRYLLRQIHQEENFRQLITDLKNEDAGRIRLGMPYWRASCTLPVIFPEFHRKYPKIQLELSASSFPQKLTDDLISGLLDIAIMNEGSIPTEALAKSVDYEILSLESFMFAVPKEHPAIKEYLALPEDQRPSPVTLLGKIPLVTTKTAQSLPVLAENLAKKYHVKPDFLLETNNFASSVNLVSTGLACTFTMEGEILVPGRTDHILYVPVEFPIEKHAIVAVYRKDAYLPKILTLFIENAKECFSNAMEKAREQYLH